ncbi:Glycosyltransferase involved in cell wall bisynthesis [Yoonia tamlensis]|uniref:Glycosyltransferase involved in cell wall bisynthesis n=1 Tax=Yoonia tamlensis TaxID=390270 RepID=A0A1I6GR18_9RHOB|nr:glycosyltransferase [Yoonia tamlensis]SFR44559.1 Glycosyltransferase involved in cell wall bisynthesis [Yoonia tamlensis]
MKLLHVTPSYYPATYWGGPIWSTKAICDGIAQHPDFAVRVLTTDAAGPALRARVTAQPQPYPVHYARRVAGHAIAPGLLAGLARAVAWADVVHLTGTYSFPTLPTLACARALRKPLVWSPRGALQATQDWPDAPRRKQKQKFEKLAQMLRARDVVLHVTSDAEARQSVTRLGNIRTALIPNAVPVPPQTHRPNQPATRLLFLGRLHPKKGLDLLLDAMTRLPQAVTLDIYGTGEAAYVARIRAACGARIRLHGHADAAAKARAFASADLFVLPSHSENFGIAVAEALAHGVPVLTTSQTPWQRLDALGCGACVDLDRTDLAQEIARLLAQDLFAMGARGRAWMQREFAPSVMVDRFAQLYLDCTRPLARQVPA